MLCLLSDTAVDFLRLHNARAFFVCQENCASRTKIGAVLVRSFSLFQSNGVRLVWKFYFVCLIARRTGRRTDLVCVLSGRQPTKSTTVPRCTIPARSRASQLVSRMQPCDSVFPIFS